MRRIPTAAAVLALAVGGCGGSDDPPASEPEGLAWDGAHLWVVDQAGGRVVTHPDVRRTYTMPLP